MTTPTNSLWSARRLTDQPRGNDNPSMPRSDLPVEHSISGFYTAAVIRCRHYTFAFIALVFLLSLNGQWRIGIDSAQYRGIAESLAEGRGYTFGGVRQDTIYPGLPAMLAGLQLVFGHSVMSVWPPVLVLTAMAVGSLVLVYRLVRLHFPQWVALCVTIGTALNERFLQLSQELLTDIPFLFGVLASLWGWELLREARDWRQRLVPVGVLGLGLVLAASMRPTFWLLAIAWISVCLWGLFRGPRKFHAISLTVLLVAWSIVIALDPRVGGFNLLAGGYEQTALHGLADAWNGLRQQLGPVFRRDLPEAFFGESMGPLGPVFSLLLIAGVVVVLRRQPLWGLLALLAILVTLLLDFTSTPRYYLMILPTLWLGWVLLSSRLVLGLREPWRNGALGGLLLLGLLPNFGGIASFIIEQRRVDFLAGYERGQYVPLVAIAGHIRQFVPEGARVVGPYSAVLTYLSGRRVLGGNQLLLDKPVSRHLEVLQAFDPQYAVFPVRFYRARDARLVPLLERRLLTPTRVLAHDGEIYLAEVAVKQVEGDWRLVRNDLKSPPKKPATAVARKKKPQPATHGTSPTTVATRKKKPKPTTDGTPPTTVATRKKKPQRATVATQSATDTTQPTRKKKKPSTTVVETRPTTEPATAPVRKKKRPATTMSADLAPGGAPATQPTTTPSRKKKKKPATTQATQPTAEAANPSPVAWPAGDAATTEPVPP